MGRLVLGALAAAVVMFAIGFGFYATPLSKIAVSFTSDASGAAIQQALRTLPADGFYAIPNPMTPVGAAAFPAGPTGFVHVNVGGRPLFDPLMLVKGFAHYLVVALLLTLGFRRIAHGSRSVAAVLVAAVAVVYIHLAGPIWWGYNWTTALFFAVADFCAILAGGLVVARFMRGSKLRQ